MLKLRARTKAVLIIIGIATSLVLAVAAFASITHVVSAQNMTSSLKQKALKTLGFGNITNSSNATSSSLKASEIIRNMTIK